MGQPELEITRYNQWKSAPAKSPNPVVYFCMEYGLHESIPLYSGGLGVLAGDHFKQAADMKLPFMAIGLMYHYGYFQQKGDVQKGQLENYPQTKLETLPLEALLDDDNNEIVVEVPVADRMIYARVNVLSAGDSKLYLLDTDVDKNNKDDRSLSFSLYGGDETHRISQELVLGVGGVQLLNILHIQPAIVHLNEGHAAFTLLERIKPLVKKGMSFDDAIAKLSENTLFTTHTCAGRQ